MVCDCEEPDCPDFAVTEEDLRLYKLDAPRLAEAIRAALAVKKPVRRLPEFECVFALGTFQCATQASAPVFFLPPSSPEGLSQTLSSLATSHDRKFAAVLFTRTGIDSRLETSLRARVLFVFADEHLQLADDGTVFCTTVPAALFATLTQPTARQQMTEADAERMFELADRMNARRRRGPTSRELVNLYAREGMSLREIGKSKRGWTYATVRNMADRLKKAGVDLDALRVHFSRDPEAALAEKGLDRPAVYRRGLTGSGPDDED